MTVSLKIFNHAEGGTTFEGERSLEGDSITIGRSNNCTLKLHDPEKRLSRVQAELNRTRDGYQLLVVSQYFPVLVNGQAHPPGSATAIRAGDSIVMDVYELEIIDLGRRSASATEATVIPAPRIRPAAAVAADVAADMPGMSDDTPAPSEPSVPLTQRPVAAPASAAANPVATSAPRPAAAPAPFPAGLSATRLADLPGASAYQTSAGGEGTSVQIASLQAGHVLAGRFRVEEQIGAGGMGAVYRAHDALRGEDIALKVMLPGLLASEQAKQRFMNEAKIALRLRHPGIVSVYDVQADGAYLFLTMELLQGRTLREAMEERKRAGTPCSEAEALEVIRPLCEALSYAHQYTVHRDVKPENVWLGSDGSIKLMDFGIARVLSGSQMTQTAAVMGTAYYMAPEQLTGAHDVDHRADQYALGVMLYEMLTGRIPAGRIEPLGVSRPDLSDSLALAADRALAGRADDRFATDTELLAALTAPPGRGVAPLKAFGRRTGMSPARIRQFGLGAAALAAVLVIALLWPMIKGLFPDREAERKAEQEVARLDGEARSLLKLVENDRREAKEDATAASRELERVDAQVRAARSPQERAALEAALREARDKLGLSQELERKLRERAEGPEGVPKAEGNVNAAVVAIKGKDRVEAVRLLKATVTSLNALRSATAEDKKVALDQQQLLLEKRGVEERLSAQARAEAEAQAAAAAHAKAKSAAAASAAKPDPKNDTRARAAEALRGISGSAGKSNDQMMKMLEKMTR